MTKLRIAILGSILSSFVGCKSEGHATQFCLGADGTSQDCGLGCTIEKNEKACAKWAEMTKELCGKISKEQCQEICEQDKNPTACELVKNWKS